MAFQTSIPYQLLSKQDWGSPSNRDRSRQNFTFLRACKNSFRVNGLGGTSSSSASNTVQKTVCFVRLSFPKLPQKAITPAQCLGCVTSSFRLLSVTKLGASSSITSCCSSLFRRQESPSATTCVVFDLYSTFQSSSANRRPHPLAVEMSPLG